MSQLMTTSSRSPSLPTRVTREVERQGHNGIVAAARVNAAAFVTHQALILTATLSETEAQLIQACPLAEPRLKLINDAFALRAMYEIQSFGS